MLDWHSKLGTGPDSSLLGTAAGGDVVSDVTTLPALTEHLQVNGGRMLIKLNLNNTVSLI